MQVNYTCRRIAFQYQVANGMHEVRLAQPDTAIDEQRVIGSSGVFPHLHGGSAGQLVGLSADKRCEGEFLVKIALVLAGYRLVNRSRS